MTESLPALNTVLTGTLLLKIRQLLRKHYQNVLQSLQKIACCEQRYV